MLPRCFAWVGLQETTLLKQWPLSSLVTSPALLVGSGRHSAVSSRWHSGSWTSQSHSVLPLPQPLGTLFAHYSSRDLFSVDGLWWIWVLGALIVMQGNSISPLIYDFSLTVRYSAFIATRLCVCISYFNMCRCRCSYECVQLCVQIGVCLIITGCWNNSEQTLLDLD